MFHKAVKQIKDYIRKKEKLYSIAEPIYYCCAKVIELVRIFFAKRGILKYCFLYPIGSVYRVIRAGLQSSYLKDIKDIKDIYKGKRCFIVATGPSLRIDDLDKLYENQELTFGLNSIYLLYNQTKWRPDFYCCLDLEVEKKIETTLGKTALGNMGKRFCFVDSQVKPKKMPDTIKYIYYNRLIHGHKTLGDNMFRYSDNLIWGLYDMYTVTCSAIQIAKWMGFSDVYLLGVDCDSSGKQKYVRGAEMFTPSELSEEDYLYNQTQQRKGYLFLKRHINNCDDFKVYNATRGGKLDAFPRVAFDEIINET